MRLEKHPAEYELEMISIYQGKINTLLNELKSLDCSYLQSVTYSHFKTSNRNYSSRIEDDIITADIQRKKLAGKITYYLKQRERLINNILGMENSDYAVMLSLLFIERKQAKRVVEEMERSESWFRQNRRRALEEYSKAYMEDPEREKDETETQELYS